MHVSAADARAITGMFVLPRACVRRGRNTTHYDSIRLNTSQYDSIRLNTMQYDLLRLNATQCE